VLALTRAGIRARAWEEDSQVALRVVPGGSREDGASGSVAQAWVYAGSEDSDRDLAETVATINSPAEEFETPEI